MKTHVNDFSYSDSTSKGIEKSGIEALSRALSMRRMIAFTASGTTMEYGRPAWVDLVNTYIRLAEKNYDRLRELREKLITHDDEKTVNSIISPEYDEIWEEFVSLFERIRYRSERHGSNETSVHPTRLEALNSARNNTRDYWDIPKVLKDRPDFVTTFLSICEDLATHVIEGDKETREDRLTEVRSEIANQFAKTNLSDFHQATLESVYTGSRQTKEEKQAFKDEALGRLDLAGDASKDDIKKTLSALYDDFYLRESHDASDIRRVNSNARIAILCHTLQLICEGENQKDCFDFKALLKPMFEQRLDPLSVIYNDLEIRRFLTLNFDIEIERMLATHYANDNDTRHKDFLDFVKKPVNDDTHRKSKRDLTNGLQQAVRSATIGQGNLGDLFTFGAFPANFDALVFHLHGRVDDPENMIITQMDYERLYLKSTNLQRSFEEARHAVFNGSDILFVGTGLNESDVIAPLRDFTARHRQMDDVSGRVYALLLSSTSKKYKGENIGLAQTLYKNYGVYTIFVDGVSGDCEKAEKHRALRKDRFYLEHLVDVLNHNQGDESNDEDKSEEKANYKISGSDLTGFVSRIKRYKKYDKSLKGREIKVAFDVLNSTCDGLLEAATLEENNTLSGLKNIELSEEKCQILRHIMLALLSRIRSRALEESLHELAEQRIEWWKRWKLRPEHRVAIYGDFSRTTQNTPLLWVRQQATYVYPKESLEEFLHDDTQAKQSSYFVHYLKALSELEVDKPVKRTRIKRVIAPKGAGKGSIVRFLSQLFKSGGGGERYPYQYIFSKAAGNSEGKHLERCEPVEYVGGFFAHLTFTLEFTSTIFALVRFIVKAADIHCEQLTPESISSNAHNRHAGLWLLRKALLELRKKEKAEKKKLRVFICLSGLYRLVDEQGDAHSPVHRAFFRILTEGRSGKKSGSVDLLLIAQEQQYPIRYLSKSVSKKSFALTGSKAKKYDYRKDRRVWLKRWDTLPLATLQQSLEVAIFVADRHFQEFLDCRYSHADLKSLILELLSKDSGGSDWGDLIDFVQERVVYVHILVRLLFWHRAVHIAVTDQDQFKAGVTSLLGRLAIVIGQGAEQDLMRQLILEYRRLDQACLTIAGSCQRQAVEKLGSKIGVDVLDVIMRHLALFNYPVQFSVLLSCPDLVYRLEPLKEAGKSDDKVPFSKKEEIIQHALSLLVKRGIVVKVEPYCPDSRAAAKQSDKDMRCRYILHRDAAEVITRDMNYITQYGVSAAPYQSTFYCAQVQSRRGIPSVEHFNFVSNLLSCSLSQNHDLTGRISLDSAKEFTAPSDANDFYKACAIIRGAYAILRGSFSIGAVSRLGQSGDFHNKQPYEAYRSWIQDILNSAVGLSEYREKVRESYRTQADFNEERFESDFNLPFYRDEVAWLYNEYAVVSFMQGRLFDASALYNQAIRSLISQEKELDEQSVGAPRRRIQLNLALTEIELGNIRDASFLLDKIIGEVVLKPHSTQSVTIIYAKGYRALCDHLTGNFTQAEKGYRSVIKKVLKMRQLRAASIFKRHLADLLRVQGRLEDAKKYLLLSEKTATQSQQEDILHYTLIARARLMRDLESRSEALQILRQTEDYAKAMGLQKMLAETLKVRAEVMLAEGEVTQAGKMAAQSVAISKRNGMRLRKISAALLQAKVCAKRKQVDFAEQILNEIDQEVSELSYTLKSGDAQKFRQSLL